jgi:hypothetical protein
MGLLEYLDKLVTEHGSAAVLDKHLAFVREQAQALEKQVTDLQRENTTLKKRVADLQAEVASKTALDEFVECRGAFFKRKPTGGYHHAVFCPDCRGPMMSLMDELPFNCHKCKRSVSFTGHDLPTVMRELT